MTRVDDALLSNGTPVQLATWEGQGPTEHTAHTHAARFDEASGRGQFSFYDSTKQYMRNTWAFEHMGHCRVSVDSQTVMLFRNPQTDSWHTIDALDIDHVAQVMDHFGKVGVRTVGDGMMAYNDVSNLRLLPSAYNRARSAVDDMIDPASGPDGAEALEAWKRSKFGFDSSPDAQIPIFDPALHAVRHRSQEPWSLEDGRTGLYFDQRIRDVWFEQELAKSYVGDAQFEYEGRACRVPLFLCVASGQYVTRDAFDIDHERPFMERLKSGIEAAEANGETFTKARALDIFNDIENLRLVSRSANSSHDYELAEDGIRLLTDLREERRDALRDDFDDDEADFIDDDDATIAALPAPLAALVSDDLPTIRVEAVMLPGGKPAAALPSAIDDDGVPATVVQTVRRGLDPEAGLDNAANPSHEVFRTVNAALRDDLVEIKQSVHPTNTRVRLNDAEIEDSERAAATVVAVARRERMTIGQVGLTDAGMIEVRGRTPEGMPTGFELAFNRAAEQPIEASSARWRERWYEDLHAPARRGLAELAQASGTPESPQALNNAAVALAKAAEARGIPFIDEVARDHDSGRITVRMHAPGGSALASVEVPDAELEQHRETARRIDHPLHHRHAEFQGVRAALLYEADTRGVALDDRQAGNVAAFAIARAEQAGFPISAVVLAPETRTVEVYARDAEGRGLRDPSLVLPLDRAIATSVLESSRIPPPPAELEAAPAPRASATASDVVSIGDSSHPMARGFAVMKEELRDRFWSGATEGEVGNAAAHIFAEAQVRGVSDFRLHHESRGEVWVIETGRGDAGQHFKVGLEAAAAIDIADSSRRWQDADRAPDIAQTHPTAPFQGR